MDNDNILVEAGFFKSGSDNVKAQMSRKQPRKKKHEAPAPDEATKADNTGEGVKKEEGDAPKADANDLKVVADIFRRTEKVKNPDFEKLDKRDEVVEEYLNKVATLLGIFSNFISGGKDKEIDSIVMANLEKSKVLDDAADIEFQRRLQKMQKDILEFSKVIKTDYKDMEKIYLRK